jgi:lipopolysaccharide transport system ATP-binding protein
MSSDEFAIRVCDVSKHYVLFDRPEDRLKQMVIPRLERMAGRTPRRYYRDFAALTDVSFEVKRGETVGIIGRNGSGKSTLLQIICGTLQPTRGKVDVNGRIAALLELGAGFNPDFTGRENVLLNAAILGLSRSEIEHRFDDIARFADIGAFIDQPVKTYSSGMYVRLAFATAINVDPDILVVDEALAVGDEAFQRKCYARIEQIKERGGTILFVSHGAQTIVQLCSRALLFDRGEFLLEGRPKTVVAQYQRLANASPAAAPGIREIIAAMCNLPEAGSETTGTTPTEVPEGVNGRAMDKAPITDTPDSQDLHHADYFDPNLKPQSTVFHEERGAKIRDARITTLTGKHVNVLQMGRRYLFEYLVDFSISATDVGFGMWLTSKKGQTLTGFHTSSVQSHKVSINAPKTALVQFEFVCMLLPSTYFGNAGVRGRAPREEILLHRGTDLLTFSVAPEAQLPAIGIFDSGTTPRITLTERVE